ncbi:hypothetical protein D3C75_1172890 [compost metagenome]
MKFCQRLACNQACALTVAGFHLKSALCQIAQVERLVTVPAEGGVGGDADFHQRQHWSSFGVIEIGGAVPTAGGAVKHL